MTDESDSVGTETTKTKEKGSARALFQCGLALMIIVTIILILEVFTAFYKSGYVFTNLPEYVDNLFIILPEPIVLFSLTGTALQIYYLLLLAAMAASLAYLFYKAFGPMRNFIKKKDPEPVKNTALFEVSVLFAALYFIELVFIFVIIALGTDPVDPFVDESVWEMMFLLLEASVWEELITRVLMIGLPMLIIALILKTKGTEWWKYLLGGFGMSRTALILIFFSAVMFGLAHVPGWDLWKFFPAFLFGLITGYLFVKYGLYAAIAIHFLTDYLASSDWLYGDGGVTISIFVLLVSLFGIPYIWIYVKRGAAYVKDAVMMNEH